MNAPNHLIEAFREQILNAASNKTQLSIEGGGTKSWYGNPNNHARLDTRTYSGILEYQPEELVITACAGTPLKEIEAALKEKNQMLMESSSSASYMRPPAIATSMEPAEHLFLNSSNCFFK